MATLRQEFLKSADPQLVNYNFVDFVRRQATMVLYAGETSNEKRLDLNTFYSDAYSTNTPSGNNGTIDADFDLDVNYPIEIEGECIVTVPILHMVDATPGAADTTITVRLRKWDGSTETEIANCSITATQPNTPASANTNTGWVYSGNFTVPRTVYKKGETLRISVATTAAGASREIILCHDPAGRDIVNVGTWIAPHAPNPQPDTTSFIINLPIRLDI